MTSATEARMKFQNTRVAIRGAMWLLSVFVFGVLLITESAAAAPPQKSFASPEDAVNALVNAVRARDRTATLSALGDAGEWLSSGDATADRAMVERFLSDYNDKHNIVRDGDKATLMIGRDEFPFAFPLVKSRDRW